MIPGGVNRSVRMPARSRPESQRTQRQPVRRTPPPVVPHAPHLTQEQHKNLTTIVHVAHHLGVSKKPLKAAIETALVESHLRNLAGGDRDSVGVFQQRPSQGWTGLTNVPRATREFLTQAVAQQHRYQTSGTLAQAVQRSAYPRRYQQHSAEAEALLRLLLT